VDETGIVIAGHGILLAARWLGLQEVKVIVVDHLTETQKRAYLIADNQLAANSSWDEDKLSHELDALEKELFNVIELGFSPQELDRLLYDLAPERLPEDEDSVPEKPTLAVAAPGDVWVLDRHRILCGDATSSDSLKEVLDGQPADMVFTDLPYNVDYTQEGGRNQNGLRQIANDNLGAAFEQFLCAACVQVLSVTGGAVYICMSSSELHTLYKAFTAAGGHWSTFLIWDKGHFTLGRSDYQRQYEPILYGWREGQEHFWCQARNEGDVWFVAKPQVNALHPTMKPVSLIERAIRNSSRRGDVVLDPFGGSGPALIACQKAGRRARLVELVPQYVDVIIRRWEAYTGREAHRESDGHCFAELLRQRQLVGV